MHLILDYIKLTDSNDPEFHRLPVASIADASRILDRIGWEHLDTAEVYLEARANRVIAQYNAARQVRA